MKTLRDFAKSAAHITGEEPGVIFGRYLEGLCVAIRRANARAVLRRMAATPDYVSAPVASAIAALAGTPG